MTPSAKQPPTCDFVTHGQCSGNRKSCADVRRGWIVTMLLLAVGLFGWAGIDVLGQHEINAKQGEQISSIDRSLGEVKSELHEIKTILLEGLKRGAKP
jgi:hypothetical protein